MCVNKALYKNFFFTYTAEIKNWKHVLAFMFFVYYLFVCLIIFLHFYICNFWFILANNRILVFILELFLFLKFLTMFLPVNMHKFCKYILNGTYIWKQLFKGSPWNGYFIYTWGIPVVGSISSGAAGTMSADLVGVGSLVGVSQLFYLFIVWTAVFWGIAFSGCFIILSTLFILTYMEGNLDKCLVLYQFFIKHQLCVGDLQSFLQFYSLDVFLTVSF